MSASTASYLNAVFFSFFLIGLLDKIDRLMAKGSEFKYALFRLCVTDNSRDKTLSSADEIFSVIITKFVIFWFFFPFAIGGFTKSIAWDALLFALFSMASYKETTARTQNKKLILIAISIVCVIITTLCVTKLDDNFMWCNILTYCEHMDVKKGICSFTVPDLSDIPVAD